MYADELMRPWHDRLVADLPDLRLLDAHAHTGSEDPDGFRCSAEELVAALDLVGARSAFFPMQEPGGYKRANDRVLAEAEASGGALVPFCRLDPSDGAAVEAERCLERGARGMKLHPRAERFGLDHPGIEAVFALADERSAPVLVHAGRGIPALGRHALELCARFPGARLILGHAGICDLAWLWRHASDHPNLYFDTSWWSPADLVALFSLVPPGQVLWASDAPYGTPLQASILGLRCALQAGLGTEQVRAAAGGQMERLVAWEEPLEVGPAPGGSRVEIDLLLERVVACLIGAVSLMLPGEDASEPLALARLACEVEEGAPQAEVCRSVLWLLDIHERYVREVGPDNPRYSPGVHLVITALCVARTPTVPLPSAAGSALAV